MALTQLETKQKDGGGATGSFIQKPSKSVIQMSSEIQNLKHELKIETEKLSFANKNNHKLKKQIDFLKNQLQSMQEINLKYTSDLTTTKALAIAIQKAKTDGQKVWTRNELLEKENLYMNKKLQDFALDYCKKSSEFDRYKEHLTDTFDINFDQEFGLAWMGAPEGSSANFMTEYLTDSKIEELEAELSSLQQK